MKLPVLLLLLAVLSLATTTTPHQGQANVGSKPVIKTGADQTDKYLPYLKGKRVAVMANPTSVIGNTSLVDSLHKLGVRIVKVFGPEHGFRGNASAGAV